jgi:hypothetical protein
MRLRQGNAANVAGLLLEHDLVRKPVPTFGIMPLCPADDARGTAYMSGMSDDPMPPERPKVEPEIILPGESGPRPRGASWVWVSSGRGQGRTLRFETRGPLALVTALLMLGLGSAVVLALLLGLVLLWIPVSIAIAAAILRSFWRRK